MEPSPPSARPWPTASPGTLAAAVVVAAAAVRLGAFVAGSGDPYVQFRQGDEAYYHAWATAIAQGHWARGASFFTTPLYAYVLALLYRIAGDGLALARSLNVLLGVGTVALVFLAARRWVGRGAAVAAAALVGFCAAPVSYELFAEKTSLVLFLTALTFHQVGRASERGTPGRWLLAGLSGGAASLAHTLLLVAAPAVWAHLAVNARGAGRPAARSAAFFTLGFALALAPATAHNWLQDRSFLLVCSTGGNTFYMGNGEGNLTGAYTVPPFAVSNAVSEERGFAAEAERRTGRRLRPSEVSAFWLREGLRDIAAQPALAARRFWRRFRWTVGAAEITDTRTFEFYEERHRPLRLLPWGFGLVSALGLTGLALAAGSRALAFPVAFTALFTAGTSAILVYGRYRLPLIVPLSLLGALALARAVEWARRRRTGALAALGALAAALGWFVYAPVPPLDEVSFFIDYSNQGNRYWDRGEFERAFAEYEKALRVRPGDLPAVPRLYARLGGIYAGRGELRRSEALLREGAARYPADREIGALLQEVSRRLAGTGASASP
ncbi:MAG TPA: glycosyltransferase family 39 protein [bacterium]